jgi:hypothetical protein
MRRGLSVVGCDGPAVIPIHLDAMRSHIDHGFDGEHHPRPQFRAALFLAEVRHFRGFVQVAPASVSHEVSDNGEAGIKNDLFDSD